MNQQVQSLKRLIPAAAAALFLIACAPAATKPDGADALHAKLSRLQADPLLASRAPVALKEAEQAVQVAEQPTEDRELGQHRVLIADRKLDIASARAQSRLLEDQRKTLAEQRESSRLEARTSEADRAHRDVRIARNEADLARGQAEAATQATQTAQQQTEELQRQIAELSAKESERGLVVTLGDLLFATGRSDLRGSASAHLSKLALFLNRYPERTVIIEGHTDTVGSEDSNQGLSQRRADAVKAYLAGQGVSAARLTSAGLGEGSPVGSNDSASGRQQNRRVEVIISNSLISSK
jgi:outer membrane protein OmpA-like peptidoglycan-associated protein